MSTDAYTEDEITAFSQKLEEWGTTLPERDQVLLLELVARASQAGGEVEGFSFGLLDPGTTFNAANVGNAGVGIDIGNANVGIRPEHLTVGQVSTMGTSALGHVPGLRVPPEQRW